METKKDIRKCIFSRREAAKEEDLLTGSARIFQKVCQTEEYRRARSVYAYMDFRREVQTREFIQQAWREGKKVAVPKVVGKDLIFYQLESFQQLEPRYFGIEEPISGIPAEDEEALLIVPGVAFDIHRHRIGYGQGFYDRYLSHHSHHATIAVAFDFQVLEEVPFEATDICPNLLITERQTYRNYFESPDKQPG